MENSYSLSLPDNFQKLLNELTQTLSPKKAKKIESMGAVARAWAKENDDYVAYVNATYLFIKARRKFTALVMPYIQHGGHNSKQRDMLATLADFNLDRYEWHRRVRESEVPDEVIEKYFFDVTENKWNPSVAGLMNFFRGGGQFRHTPREQTPVTCPNCGHVIQERKEPNVTQ
jgi:uncharacterized C2H2 Zn-finger protein